jgi:predicted ATPase
VPFGSEREGGETQLVQVLPNARAALQWTEERSEAEIGLRLVNTFGKFWYSRGQMSEAEGWLERMLALDERLESREYRMCCAQMSSTSSEKRS